MRKSQTSRLLIAMMAMVFLLAMPLAVNAADDFYLYDGQTAAEVTTNSLPAVEGPSPSWFTAAEYFQGGTYAGRIIAVTGKNIYLETAAGSGTYQQAATIASAASNMDPSFVRVSPDGGRIALGIGYGTPLLVFPTTTLNPTGPPPDLLLDASVTSYNVNYYDADWALDNQHLLVDGGVWPDPPYSSGVG